MRSVLLVLAAMLCGAPATIAAGVLLPWSVGVGIYGMTENPALALANLALVVASVFALASYWHLVARTSKTLPFKLGWIFGLSCVAAMASTVAVFDAMPLLPALLVVVPIWTATCFCLFKQRAIHGLQNDA